MEDIPEAISKDELLADFHYQLAKASAADLEDLAVMWAVLTDQIRNDPAFALEDLAVERAFLTRQ